MLQFPSISPVAFSIAGLDFHWYGLMYVLGFLAFWVLGRWRAVHCSPRLPLEWVDDLIFYGAIGVVLGGRIGYIVFYQWDAFLMDWTLLFRIWQGGMSFHGGLIGVLLVLWLFARQKKYHFLKLADFVVPSIPPSLLAGRIGNFINGELWGRPSDLPWAMVFPHVDEVPRHPSQLYEAVLEGALLFVILWIYAARPRATGRVAALFLILYGLMRFLVEFVREPDTHIQFVAWEWLTMGQLLCLPLILAGVFLWYWSSMRSGQHAPIS